MKPKKMGWIYLIIAGIFEIGWPLSLKLSEVMENKAFGIVLAAISMGLSCFFLYIAQQTISIGTAYAVWTGIGAVGTLIVGILLFGDSTSFWRLFSAFLIVVGIIGLKLSH